MPRWIWFLVFMLVVTSVMVAIHVFLWMRLVRDPQLVPPWRMISTITLVMLSLSMPAVFTLGPILSPPLRNLVAWPAFVWMGSMFILLVVLVGADLARVAGLVAFKSVAGGAPSPGAALLIARVAAAGAVVATIALSVHAMVGAGVGPVIREVEIRVPGLSAEMDGTSIALLSDTHVGATLDRRFVRRVVDLTNAARPDLVAITGDLVDYGVSRLGHEVLPLSDLRTRYGVFFVTGNHEYYAGAEEWVLLLRSLGVRVLLNEHEVIGGEEHGFVLAGVTDPAGKMFPGHAPDLSRALEGVDPARRPVVLLAHQPLAVREAAAMGVAVQLSGHTHAGQIWPWSYAVRLQQPYVKGLARHGPTQLYVSPGTGYWGPPMRLGTRAEITKIILRRVDPHSVL